MGLIARCYAVKHPPALKFIVWITMPRHDSRKKWTWRVGDVPITTHDQGYSAARESRKKPQPYQIQLGNQGISGREKMNIIHGMQRKYRGRKNGLQPKKDRGRSKLFCRALYIDKSMQTL